MQKKSIESNKDKLMSKKKLKAKTREKGITLIALVITIIVLLILAGITINSVIGSKGILNNAKKAANAYNKSATEENKVLDYYVNEIEKADNGNNTGPSSGSNPGSTGGGSNPGSTSGGSPSSSGDAPNITYTDTNNKPQPLTKDTPAGTKIGTTANIDGQTLDWYLFDVSDDGKTAYLVSTPTNWVPDTTKEVSGAWVPKLVSVSSYDSGAYAMRQAIQKLPNGTDSYNQSSVTYTPSANAWNYIKIANSQWSTNRGSVDFRRLNENEQAACYLADVDIFAGIKDQVKKADGNLKGKIQTLVGGASIEQWCKAYNKQSEVQNDKNKQITCEYSASRVPGYIYKVNGTAQNSGWWTNLNTIFGNDIYGAAKNNIANNYDTAHNPFYSCWLFASPLSFGSNYMCYVEGNSSNLYYGHSNDCFFRLSLFASVAL